ncbi:MAG: LacI family DNA-binding transcriptional regulator [Lentisphaeria bacterium]|nr:LacI family DNA-binding transcriptional regulator [Lentisphaeria bacterium]
MAVTILDIAAAANCNASTVSRALRDDPRITPERKKLIRQLAMNMNYIPNRIAKQLADGKTKLVLFVIGELELEHTAPIASALDHELEEFGYTLTIMTNSLREGKFHNVISLCEQRFCDAAVLFSPLAQPDDLPSFNRLIANKFPIVCVDQYLKNYPFPALTNDARLSIKLLGQKMLDAGMNIGLTLFPNLNTTGEFRLNESEKFLDSLNIPHIRTLEELPELLKKYPNANLGIFADNPSIDGLNEIMIKHRHVRCIGGMFDSWKFNAPECFDTIFLCLQDVTTAGKLAGEYIVRMLRGDDSIEKVTMIPPASIITPHVKKY